MDHPTAMQALLTGQIDAHLTSPPYQLQEKVRGAHVVARSDQYFGASSFLSAWMATKFYAQYPAFAAAFYADVNGAIKLINTNPLKVSAAAAGRRRRHPDLAAVQAVARELGPHLHDAPARAHALRDLHEPDRDDREAA